jgi:hypothetical protein
LKVNGIERSPVWTAPSFRRLSKRQGNSDHAGASDFQYALRRHRADTARLVAAGLADWQVQKTKPRTPLKTAL